MLGAAAGILFLYLLILTIVPLDPLYSAAIDSVSRLDVPAAPDLPLNPQFNLTLRVASRSLGLSACMEAGTYVEVSYRCVLLAASGATPERICAEARRPRDVSVVASGASVRVPGYMMDGLAADLRNGVRAFEITVRLSNGDFDNLRLGSCGGRRIGGDTAAALETTCQSSYMCPDHDHKRIFPEVTMKRISSLSKIM
jgi:hypothetical protein